MLKERLRFLLKDTAIYGIGNAFSKSIVFFTLPIIVNSIPTAEFGTWSLLTIVGLLISSIAVLGMDSAVIRFYYDDDSVEHHRKVFSNGLIVQFILVCILLLVGLMDVRLIVGPIGMGREIELEAQLILVWIPANVFSQYCQNWFKWTFQRAKFMTMSIGLAGTNLFLLVFCKVYFYLDLRLILWITVISYWLFALIGLAWCRDYFRVVVDRILVRKLLLFGFPMMLVMLVGTITSSLDRLFLARFLTEAQLGIYSFTQKLSIIMLVVVTAFQTAFGPFAFSIWEKPDAKITFARFQSYYLVACGVVALVICSCVRPLIIVLGSEEYLVSSPYLFILVEAIVIYGLYSFASLGIFYSKRMTNNLIALCIGLGVNFIANQLLVPVYFEYGAAIGFLLGNLTLVTSGYLFARRSFPIHFAYSRDAAILVVMSFALASTTFQLSTDTYIDALMKLATLIPAFLAISFFLLNQNDRKFISKLLKVIF